MTLGLHVGSKNASSSGIPEKFLFYIGVIVSTVLPSLVPLQRSDDCFEIHILH